jgi:hypothetical protein
MGIPIVHTRDVIDESRTMAAFVRGLFFTERTWHRHATGQTTCCKPACFVK